MSFAASGQAAAGGKALVLASATGVLVAVLLVRRWVPRPSAPGAVVKAAGAGTAGR